MFSVYTKDNCRYCKAAKELIQHVGFSEHAGNLELIDANPASVKASLKEAGFDTLPVIYFNGFLIGGYRELQTQVRESFMKGYPNNDKHDSSIHLRPRQAPAGDEQASNIWNE